MRPIREIAEEVAKSAPHDWIGFEPDRDIEGTIAFAEEVAARVLAESILDQPHAMRMSWDVTGHRPHGTP